LRSQPGGGLRYDAGTHMSETVDLYGAYRQFADPVLAAIRHETFGVDIGQNSWTTVDEYARVVPWLELPAGGHVLEVASGSGGPALHLGRMTGCRVTGIDQDAGAVDTARRMVAGLADPGQFHFEVTDATARLPFDDSSFDGVICIDAINHLMDRVAVL